MVLEELDNERTSTRRTKRFPSATSSSKKQQQQHPNPYNRHSPPPPTKSNTRMNPTSILEQMPSLVRSRNFGLAACGIGESYFTTDGDDDISKTEPWQQPALSWRGDPHLTHSDWTIVVATSQLEAQTYHVHKSILSVGPRSSKYFANLFLEQHSHQTQNSTALNWMNKMRIPFHCCWISCIIHPRRKVTTAIPYRWWWETTLPPPMQSVSAIWLASLIAKD